MTFQDEIVNKLIEMKNDLSNGENERMIKYMENMNISLRLYMDSQDEAVYTM